MLFTAPTFSHATAITLHDYSCHGASEKKHSRVHPSGDTTGKEKK